MSKKFTDLTLKATAAAADIVPINDVSASTDKKTTVGGLATAVAANLPAGSVPGSAIGSYSVSRSNNGSTVSETAAKIQSGWACGQPGVSTGLALTITFPVAFTNVPIVTASFGGDTAGVTSTLGAGGGNIKQSIVEVLSVTTTGCTLQVLTRDNTNYAAGNTVYAHWQAIGT